MMSRNPSCCYNLGFLFILLLNIICMDIMDQLLRTATTLLAITQFLVVVIIILGLAKIIDWLVDKLG
jgi:hypothetical protein